MAVAPDGMNGAHSLPQIPQYYGTNAKSKAEAAATRPWRKFLSLSLSFVAPSHFTLLSSRRRQRQNTKRMEGGRLEVDDSKAPRQGFTLLPKASYVPESQNVEEILSETSCFIGQSLIPRVFYFFSRLGGVAGDVWRPLADALFI